MFSFDRLKNVFNPFGLINGFLQSVSLLTILLNCSPLAPARTARSGPWRIFSLLFFGSIFGCHFSGFFMFFDSLFGSFFDDLSCFSHLFFAQVFYLFLLSFGIGFREARPCFFANSPAIIVVF